MTDRRVVVTGIGAITPLGHTLIETMDGVSRQASAIGPATLFDAGAFSCGDAAEIRDWDPRPSFRVPKALKLTDRPARFAVAAARMALADAAWPGDEASNDRLGVAIGTSGSDLQARDLSNALARDGADAVSDLAIFAERMLKGLNPLWLLISLPNMISAHVAIQSEARGPNTTIMSDWAAGNQAIGEAGQWIAAGEADAVLAGGADSGIHPFAYAAFDQAGWFDERDDGAFVPGEGAAVFLLEEHTAAFRRGARIYAELKAYSTRTRIRTRSGAGTLAHTLCDAMTMANWRRDQLTTCGIAAPRTRTFAQVCDEALRASLPSVAAFASLDARLGFPLAASGPISAALMLRTAPSRARLLASALGSSHEAVTLAFESAPAS